jgi:hypothetical protein
MLLPTRTGTGVSTDVVDKLAEYKGPLLADMLRTIILLTTYLPTILVNSGDTAQKDEKDRNIQLVLKRELSHLLLSGDIYIYRYAYTYTCIYICIVCIYTFTYL